MRTVSPPGALRRVLRKRPLLGVAAGLAIVIMLVLTSGEISRAVIRNALDASFRGSYDILVSGDKPLDVDVDFVDSNFGSVTPAGGISMAQWEEISQLNDVDVAAPLGVLGAQIKEPSYGGVFVPATAGAGERQGLRFAVDLHVDDGTGPRQLQQYSVTVAWDPTLLVAGTTNGIVASVPFYPFETNVPTPDGRFIDGIVIVLPKFNWGATTVVAIDPGAEEALIGAQPYLDQLTRVQTVLDEFGTVTNENIFTGGDEGPLARLAQAGVSEEMLPATDANASFVNTYLPYVRNRSGHPNMQLQLRTFAISADAIDAGMTTAPPPNSTEGTLESEFETDLQSMLGSFGRGSILLMTDGSAPLEAPALVSTATTVGIEALSLTREPEQSSTTPIYQPATFDVTSTSPTDDFEEQGRFTNFRRVIDVPQLQIGTFQQEGPIPFRAGEYDPASLDLHGDNVNNAPLGLYESPDVTVQSTGAHLDPALTGQGLVAPSAGAIISLKTAQAFGIDEPISYLRVRVSGDGGFTPDVQQRIAAVAERVQALGLSATVVSGSSADAITLDVQQVLLGDSEHPATPHYGSLGRVDYPVTRLGVTVTLDASTSELFSTLTMLALGIAGATFTLVMGLQVTERRRERRVLEAHGATKQQALGWHLRETVITLLVPIAAAGLRS